ncbi:hypothetical protein DVA67_028490 [Solirubrobacter sp. CPCC 204708]|uniref:Uncharacterized protein n=1 Tax=Solirubrobacter deserti TaxID=2282478 RepID=A0ABT4RPH0_9ACTN|nr:hypothetical protein [Solirubrobacter deserti]MBE2319938.1 hypothetical protein [Solirubrobacter deserti]MDA0140468.1 hypothetical protein [Solirubrobacter deserti]
MSKLISAIKRTLGTHAEPHVHFHQGTHAHLPEVCHEHTCGRPRLG